MLALQTLGKPLFPLHEVDWQIRSPRTISSRDLGATTGSIKSGSRLLHSRLSTIFSKDLLEIFQEVHDLLNQFEAIDQIIMTPEQPDDLEYRCVLVQYHLLFYDYSCPALGDSLLDAKTTIRQLCLIATLIFFGRSQYSQDCINSS